MNDKIDIKPLIIRLRQSFESDDTNSATKWEILNQLSVAFERSGELPDDKTSDYCVVLTILLDALKPNLFDTKKQEEQFCDFILNGSHHDSFVILAQRYSASSPSYQQAKILDILERFLRKGNIYHMIFHQCYHPDEERLKVIGNSVYWNNLITLLVSLPERVANKASERPRTIFFPATYIPFIASTIWKVLCKIYEYLQSGKSCSAGFLGKLTGKLCMTGHSSIVAKYLCKKFLASTSSDFLWRRISRTFHSKIPSAALESYLSQALPCVPWYGYMKNLFDDLVITDKTMQFLLTVKFLLCRQFNDTLILQNVIGYIARTNAKDDFFAKVLKTLLDVWSDKSAFRHQSAAQHCYLASGLVISAAHVKELNTGASYKDLVPQVLNGVQLRIASAESVVRGIGMLVGDSLVSVFDPDVPAPDFEHDFSLPEVSKLQSLRIVPPKPNQAEKDDEIIAIESLGIFKETPAAISKPKQEAVPVEEPDSDDDLEPYDMSNDLPNECKNRPFYVRDCLLGLLEAEKPEWTEQCLRHAPNLIRDNPEETIEIAVEMAKVLLHLSDTFGMSDFTACRHRALIAVTVHCPVQVAPYLTSQFYERDYNIRQRLDILEVVAAASKALSEPEFDKPPNIELPPVKDVEENWRSIIDKRLKAKTRYISLGPRRMPPEPHLNIFGTIAGHFFYPLIEKFDRKNKMLNLMGDDSYVLGRLLYTLGIVLHSSANTPACRSMGATMLKFLPAVRNHSEVFVRRAAIFAATAVFLAVPTFILFSELQEDVLSCQAWLSEIMEKDYDTECQVKAAQAAQLILKGIEEELPEIHTLMLEG